MQVSLFTSIVPYFLCLVPRGAKAQYSEAFLPPQQGGDLQPDGSLLHPTSWDFDCDPWRERPINPDADFHALNETSDVFDEWVCPEELRSVSGCGDFRHDTRGTVCETFRSLEKCSDQRVINAAQPLVPQMHVCFQHPIENYPDYGTDEGLAAPPLLGRHRPRWAKWGEYEVREIHIIASFLVFIIILSYSKTSYTIIHLTISMSPVYPSGTLVA